MITNIRIDIRIDSFEKKLGVYSPDWIVLAHADIFQDGCWVHYKTIEHCTTGNLSNAIAFIPEALKSLGVEGYAVEPCATVESAPEAEPSPKMSCPTMPKKFLDAMEAQRDELSKLNKTAFYPASPSDPKY